MPAIALILASASPQRRVLLSQLGYLFEVDPADIDEQAFPEMAPIELARRLALCKAEAVALRHPDAVVLAADTVVALGEESVGKPADEQEARQMLKLLSGTTQVVITGIAAIHQAAGFSQSGRILSAVRIKPLSEREVEDYVASGQWRGKAGGYGIQNNDPFVTGITGSRSNVIGLPLAATQQLLLNAGMSQPDGPIPGRDD